MHPSYEKILETIKLSLDLICNCRGEKDIQNILAAQLKCEVRKTISSENYPNVEIDLLGEDFAIEVKYNEKYYSGVSQILIQKTLYYINNNILLHVNSYIDLKFLNAFKTLAEEIGFKGILLNNREKSLETVNFYE